MQDRFGSGQLLPAIPALYNQNNASESPLLAPISFVFMLMRKHYGPGAFADSESQIPNEELRRGVDGG